MTKYNRTRAGQKLLCGLGLNDTTDKVFEVFPDGTKWWCPIYSCWYNMLRRVSGKYDTHRNESYKKVSATDDFLLFSKFKPWMQEQAWEGNTLDKDIFGDGTLYSFETCCFIPNDVNVFLTGLHTPVERVYGVTYRPKTGNWMARVYYKNEHHTVGTFANKYSARAAYVKKKLEFFNEVIIDHKLPDHIAEAVINKYQKAYDEAILYSLKGE